MDRDAEQMRRFLSERSLKELFQYHSMRLRKLLVEIFYSASPHPYTLRTGEGPKP